MFKPKIKDYDLDLYEPSLITELIGFASIAILCLIVLIISLRWNDISKIIWTAFIVRLIVMLLGHYFINLPDSTNDALGFESGAWVMAQSGFLNISDNFPGFNSFFYTWLISIPYTIFGRSILMMQSINLLFGLLSILLIWLITKKIWDDETANKVGWVSALFPSLILYSVLPLREAGAGFFLLVAIIGVINWYKTKDLISITLITIGFIGAGFFHGVLALGIIIFISIISFDYLKIFINSLVKRRLHLKSFLVIIFSIILFSSIVSNKLRVQYIGNFESIKKLERISNTILVRLKGGAAYGEWSKINSITEIFYKLPSRFVYFLYSPFPWDIKKTTHLFGLFDGFLYLLLSIFIVLNRKAIFKDPSLKIIFIIILLYLIIFSLGVSNFGAGLRHRTKFVLELILLAGPLIPKIYLSKKKLIKYIK